MENGHDGIAVTPYFFAAQSIPGAVEEYVSHLDCLEASLRAMQEAQGSPIDARTFSTSIPTSFAKNKTGKRILFDMVLLITMDTLRSNGDKLEASTMLQMMREYVTTPPPDGTSEHLGAIGEVEAEEEGKSLTTLAFSDFFAFATSKAMTKQPIIAAAGADGREVSVDSHGTYITAAIYGESGQPVEIHQEQIQLQTVLGEMIYSNGGNPITVTPAQIFRKYAGLEPGENVTPQQEKEIEDLLDPLLFMEASLDFTMQIAKHKSIKRQHDYDYSRTRITRSHLVIGKKETDEIKYNGTTVKTAYTIYEAPMFYEYSRAINQIGFADRKLLAGGGAARSLPKGHPDGKKVRRTVKTATLRRYLTLQVDRISHTCGKSCKQNLTFATIAGDNGIDSTPKKMRQLREDVMAILLDFKADGFIRGACEYKKGRAIVGVTITVTPCE